jgi:hypothetical protein
MLSYAVKTNLNLTGFGQVAEWRIPLHSSKVVAAVP